MLDKNNQNEAVVSATELITSKSATNDKPDPVYDSEKVKCFFSRVSSLIYGC